MGDQNFQHFEQAKNKTRKKEGEITIESNPKKSSDKNKEGDYTDFEEIK